MVTACDARSITESLNDEALVDCASAGSRNAWQILLARHERTFFRLAMSVVKEEQAADDVVQVALISIYSKIDSFDGRGAFSSWANRVVFNAALMHLRKRKRRKEVSIEKVAPATGDDERILEFPTIDAPRRPDEVFANRELGAEILDAINALEPKYRRIVELREFHGFTMRELAEALGLSVGGAKTRLHRARGLLRVSLSSYDPRRVA